MPSTLAVSSPDESKMTSREIKLILIWGLTNLLVVMNTTMFNVALPSVIVDFSINSSIASWLVSGYSIMFAISTVTFSRLSDFIPLSRLLFIGISIFGVASVVGFFANHFYILLGSRILQAAGGGASMGMAMVMAGRYIPLARRGKAMAITSAGAALAMGLGPIVGGLIIQFFGWKYLFAISCFAVLTIPFFQKLLPLETMKKGNFDLYGAILTGLSVTGLLLFLFTFSYSLLAVAIILIVIGWKYFNKVEEPFIPPILIKNKQYAKLLFVGCFSFLVSFANLFLLPILLSTAFGIGAAKIGVIIFPGAILAVTAGQFIGRLIDRFGTAPLIIFGQWSLLSSTILFALFATVKPAFVLVIYILASIGNTAVGASVSNEVTRILPQERIGSGIGVLQLIQFFGAALGTAISGILLTSQDHLSLQLVYRNIYICLSAVIIIAVFIYNSYYRSAKLKKQLS